MGGDDPRRQSNVIIPDTGAGPYWYVDPRAGTQQQMQQGPTMSMEHPGIEVMKAVQRLINPNPDDQVAASAAISRMSGQKSYDPMEQVRRDASQKEAFDKEFHQMGPQDVYKTVGIDIHGKEMEVPAVFDNMTEDERNIINYLPHTQWPDDIHKKIRQNAIDNFKQGLDAFGNPITSNFGF